MALKLYDESDIQDIADAIRGKNGSSDTYTVSQMAQAIDDIPSGGGNIGGLANMVDINNQDYQLAYMLSQMKNGNTVGGTVTWTSAFPNTETLLFDTGLSELHGIMFIGVDQDTNVNSNKIQSAKFAIITVNSDGTFNMFAQSSSGTPSAPGTAAQLSVANEELKASAPINGTLRISEGKLYYVARYNNNENYQILMKNTQYDWLAW